MPNPTDAAVARIPMDKGPWRASEDGHSIFSEDFTADVSLHIHGDFIDDHHRKDYAVWLARTLNEAARAQAPAAGDALDAVRYRFLRANAVYGRFESDDGSLALNCDEPEKEWDAHIDAAMTGGLAGGGAGHG